MTRWQFTSLVAAILIVCQGLLLWYYPTSVAVWALAALLLILGIFLYLDPAYSQLRLSKWLYGIALVQSLAPTLEASLDTSPLIIHYASASSPLCTTLFMFAGILHAWWNHREAMAKTTNGLNGPRQTTTLIGSRNALPITIGGDATFNLNGQDNGVVRELVGQNGVLIRLLQVQLSGNSTSESEAALVWRLIDGIRMARKRFEALQCTELCRQLEELLNEHEDRWPAALRREALIILAEEERSELAMARDRGEEIDLTGLKVLLERIRDVK